MLYLPLFCIIWTVLKIISNHYFHTLFHTSHQVQFKKNLTNQNSKNTPSWKNCNILLNDKTTEKKNRFVSKSLVHSPEYKDKKKEELLIEKIDSIILNDKNFINIIINDKNTKENFQSFYWIAKIQKKTHFLNKICFIIW